jgi:hypothetical protein
MLLERCVDGVLLGRVEVEGLGETGFRIGTAGSAECAALSEN